MVRRHHNVEAVRGSIVGKRRVARIARSCLNAVVFAVHRHLDRFKANAAFFAFGAAVRFPSIGIGTQAVVDINGFNRFDERLILVVKNLREYVKKRRRIPPARVGKQNTNGIERHEREFRAASAKKLIGRFAQRLDDEVFQTAREARRNRFLALLPLLRFALHLARHGFERALGFGTLDEFEVGQHRRRRSRQRLFGNGKPNGESFVEVFRIFELCRRALFDLHFAATSQSGIELRGAFFRCRLRGFLRFCCAGTLCFCHRF